MRKELREDVQRLIQEDSRLQKKIIQWIEPKNLLHLEEELKEILRVERLLIKAANRLNVTPNKLQQVIDDLLDIIDLLY